MLTKENHIFYQEYQKFIYLQEQVYNSFYEIYKKRKELCLNQIVINNILNICNYFNNIKMFFYCIIINLIILHYKNNIIHLVLFYILLLQI